MRHIFFFLNVGVLAVGFVLLAGCGATFDAPQPVPGAVIHAGSDERAVTTSQDWAQWRGPKRDGWATGQTWPGKLNGKLVARWSADIGSGYSGPCVGGGKVFTLETYKGSVEVVRAFDRKTGKELWTQQWAGSFSVPFYGNKAGSWVKSTPAYDGKSVYAMGMREHFVCMDAQAGAIKWQVNIPKKLNTSIAGYGGVASPEVVGEHVYICAGDGVVKFEKHTGKIVWHADLDNYSNGSAVFANIGGLDQIVIVNLDGPIGLDAATGKRLWKRRITSTFKMSMITPAVVGDTVYMAVHGGRMYRLNIKKTGSEWKAAEVWDNRLQSHISSPVVRDGFLYYHARNNQLNCVDAANGDIKWATGRLQFGSMSSVIINGEKILLLNGDGGLYLIKATPAGFTVLDQRKVGPQKTWAHLAAADNQIFIRERDRLTCYTWQ
jgi:outer membrane protein assembly factor BamB